MVEIKYFYNSGSGVMRKPIFKKWWFWVIIVVIAIGAMSSKAKKEIDKVVDSKPAATDAGKKDGAKKDEPKKEVSKVNYDNFLKVKMSDDYNNVTSLLGEGSELSSSEVAGIKTVIYSWNGSGFSNMNVTIQNGKVIGKAQVGLKDPDSKVTLEKYNQVKEGMSYEEVKGILGEGTLTSQTKIMQAESLIYSWVNKDGSNMNCAFSGSKVMTKAQINLK